MTDCHLHAQDFEVKYYIVHESYDNKINDIGLVRLINDVLFQGSVVEYLKST